MLPSLGGAAQVVVAANERLSELTSTFKWLLMFNAASIVLCIVVGQFWTILLFGIIGIGWWSVRDETAQKPIPMQMFVSFATITAVFLGAESLISISKIYGGRLNPEDTSPAFPSATTTFGASVIFGVSARYGWLMYQEMIRCLSDLPMAIGYASNQETAFVANRGFQAFQGEGRRLGT